MLNQQKKEEPERRRPEWVIAHCKASVDTEKVYRDRASWVPCHDKLFLVATGCAGQAHDQACVHTTSLRVPLGHALNSAMRVQDRNSQLHVATGFLCYGRARAGTG